MAYAIGRLEREIPVRLLLALLVERSGQALRPLGRFLDKAARAFGMTIASAHHTAYGEERIQRVGLATTDLQRWFLQDVILNDMDHLAALREKIESLRAEISEIQELNYRYRLQGARDTLAQIAHGQRHERLQAIQQELAQVADLGRRVHSVEQMKEHHRSGPRLVKKVS